MSIKCVLSAALESGELTTLSVLGGTRYETPHEKEVKLLLSIPTKNSNCGQKVITIKKVTPSTALILEEDTLSTISSYFQIQKMLLRGIENDTYNTTHSNL